MARLIDANELIAEFEWLKSQVSTERAIELKDHIQRIKDAPTADAVEVVHGEWIDAKFVRAVKRTNLPVVQCSKCECYFCDVINNHHYMYHYCPNCGAKMDGDGNA